MMTRRSIGSEEAHIDGWSMMAVTLSGWTYSRRSRLRFLSQPTTGAANQTKYTILLLAFKSAIIALKENSSLREI
jgi:hypothetical protein